MHVSDVMSRDVVSISPKASVIDAAKKMRDQDVGTIAVIDGERLVGLLNDRQITCGVVASGKDLSKVKVEEVMTKKLVTGTPEMDLAQAARIMSKLHFRRLPVVDKNQHLRGIVSVTDIGHQFRECLDNLLDEPRRKGGIDRPSKFEEPIIPQWMFA